jgi:hypothetical protein
MRKNRFQIFKSFVIKVYHEKKIEKCKTKLRINEQFIINYNI